MTGPARDLDRDRRVEHRLGCAMEPAAHYHIIRPIGRIPDVDVAAVATTYTPHDGDTPVVIDRPPAGALETAEALARVRRLPSPAGEPGRSSALDDAPAGAGDDVEAFRG